MITIRQLIDQAESGLKAQRDIRREDKINEVYKEYPEIAEIDEMILEARKNKFISIIDNDEVLEKRFQDTEEELLKRRDAFIIRKGIDPDFDGENFICTKCNDTGFVDLGNGRKQVCECRSEDLEICYYTSGMKDYTTFKSSNYKDDYFGNAKRRSQIKKNFLKILVGSANFSKDNLWVYSDKQQSGKTFLTIIIAKTAIKLGKSAYYVKCEDLGSLSNEEIEDMKHCDFLFIDDYAPQVTTRNGVGSQLNLILEVRQAASLNTIIITSFAMSEIISDSDMRVAGKLQNSKLVIE